MKKKQRDHKIWVCPACKTKIPYAQEIIVSEKEWQHIKERFPLLRKLGK